MNRNKIVLNVGGKRFETLESTLRRIPSTLLGRIDESSPYYDKERAEFFFDRDPFLFCSVLNLYRIGELHLPHNICGPAIKRELLFWEVDENTISECCWRFYKAFEEEQTRLLRIRHAFGFNNTDFSPEMLMRRGNAQKGPQYWRLVIWRLLSAPTSSIIAKVWAWSFFLLLLLSIIIQILRSEPQFRSTKYDNATDRILRLASGGQADNSAANVLRILEDILTVFFTLELSIRFTVCPDKSRFFKDTLNWVDIICVLPMLIIFMVCIVWRTPESSDTLAYLSAYLSITGLLRVLRLLKLIQHAIGFKILILTMKASMKEILLLMGLISLGTVLFAVSVYIVEIFDENSSFPSISAGLWWAIITMTTVGYGDMTPKTFSGRVIGTLCAMSGILATGLAIPVIASNFDKFYSDAQVLKQARLTESRPKQAEMRKRARDPFSLAVQRSVGSVSTGESVPIVGRPASQQDIQIHANGDVRRCFSLSNFHNNAVAPLDVKEPPVPAPVATTPPASTPTPLQSSISIMAGLESKVPLETVTWTHSV